MIVDKRYIIAGVIVACLVIAAFIVWHREEQASRRATVPLYTLDTSFDTGRDGGKSQRQALEKIGIQKKDEPRHYITTDESRADTIAQDTARKQGADYVVKERDTTPVIIPGAKQEGNTTVYNNTYYAVSQEKKHDIKAGVAAIDDKAAAVVTYRNRELSYSIYTDGHKATGAAVQYTVKSW